MTALVLVAIALGTFAFMEGYAWFMHRYVMHGMLWCWHKSHHEPRTGRYELNDLFAVIFAMPAIVLIALGTQGRPELAAIGAGITAYGAVYAIFHDGLVHRRFSTFINPHSRFWLPRVRAHRIHHAVRTKDGCVSFGFLIVRTVAELKFDLAHVRSLRKNRPPARRRKAAFKISTKARAGVAVARERDRA